MKRLHYSALPLLALLPACMSGNVKGDFQCAAPGGTCAPMSMIDAGAIASIGNVRSVSDPGIDGPRVPQGLAGPVLADGSAPARTSDRVLRVVFPAHIDADGIYREQSAAHAVVENGAWAEALGGKPSPRGVPVLRAAGVVPTAVPPSPPRSALATLDEIVAARAAKSHGTNIDPTAPFVPTPAPTALYAPAPTAAYVPAPTASRLPIALSLAEAASGLESPRVSNLDPRAPSPNFDTPDVIAARAPEARPAPVIPVRRQAPRAVTTVTTVTSVGTAESAAASGAAPYGSRPVRWKGKTYQLPYKNGKEARADVATAVPSQPNYTADLNKAALAKAQRSLISPSQASSAPTPRAYDATSDAGIAQARVGAMAAPVLLGAIESGRDAARAAAPGGFALPLAGLKDAQK